MITLLIFFVSCTTSNYELEGTEYDTNPNSYFKEFYKLVRSDEYYPTHRIETKLKYRTDKYAERDSIDFDVNSFFSVLNHLKVRDNYKLDYVYKYYSIGGYPILYCIKKDYRQLKTVHEFDSLHISTDSFLNFIEVDDSPDSYIQIILLHIMHNQFLRYWHDFYRDEVLIFNNDGLKDVIDNGYYSYTNNYDKTLLNGYNLKKENLDFYRSSKDINPNVILKFFEKHVEMEVLIFSNWYGFKRIKFRISRIFPHRIENISKKIILAYNCNIQF